jgi:uncharacterized membrane protein
MSRNRLEAFSDGVIAILITIMVLQLKVPTSAEFSALRPLVPTLSAYVLSFVYLAIYWNNHHHMFHMVQQINGKILWANMHLLFWLSLIPFATDWLDQGGMEQIPTFVYGAVLAMAGAAYYILQITIIASQGEESKLRKAVGQDFKGKGSVLLYLAALPFVLVSTWISMGVYILVAIIWLVPDPRIESKVNL